MHKESEAAPALSAALDRLWTRFQPEIEERVAALEAAAAAVRDSSLTRAQLEAAHTAAHKLAGVLGTFGLDEGTAIARELEQAFDPAGVQDGISAGELAAAAMRLRGTIEGRKG